MATSSAATCVGSIGHQLAIVIVLLSIAAQLSPGHALPRPSIGAQPTQLLFNELLAAGAGPDNEDSNYYGDQLQQQQQLQPQQVKQMPSFNNFVNKWPSLRDLLLTADYDDEAALPVESVERERAQLGSRLLARLHRLADNGNSNGYLGDDEQLRYNVLDDMAAMPAKKQSEAVKLSSAAKQHNIKKNVQYMSPCHFKICNMGRKRNSGSYLPY